MSGEPNKNNPPRMVLPSEDAGSGITHQTVVRPSRIHGSGVFARKGDIILPGEKVFIASEHPQSHIPIMPNYSPDPNVILLSPTVAEAVKTIKPGEEIFLPPYSAIGPGDTLEGAIIMQQAGMQYAERRPRPHTEENTLDFPSTWTGGINSPDYNSDDYRATQIVSDLKNKLTYSEYDTKRRRGYSSGGYRSDWFGDSYSSLFSNSRPYQPEHSYPPSHRYRTPSTPTTMPEERFFGGKTVTVYRTRGRGRIAKADIPEDYLRELERRQMPPSRPQPMRMKPKPIMRPNSIFGLPRINNLGLLGFQSMKKAQRKKPRKS